MPLLSDKYLIPPPEREVELAQSRLSTDESARRSLSGLSLLGYALGRGQGRAADLALLEQNVQRVAELTSILKRSIDRYMGEGDPNTPDAARFLRNLIEESARSSENPYAQRLFMHSLFQYLDLQMAAAAAAAKMPDAKNRPPDEHIVNAISYQIMPRVQEQIAKTKMIRSPSEEEIKHAARSVASHAYSIINDMYLYGENNNVPISSTGAVQVGREAAAATAYWDADKGLMVPLTDVTAFAKTFDFVSKQPDPAKVQDGIERVRILRMSSGIRDATGKPLPIGWWIYRNAWPKLDLMARDLEKGLAAARQEQSKASESAKRVQERKKKLEEDIEPYVSSPSFDPLSQ